MIKIEKEKRHTIAALYKGWDETLIWSCLQGFMGQAFADREENPSSAQIIIGDFCFFSGVPNIELAENIPSDFHSDTILMIPGSEAWSELITKVYPLNHEKLLRYAIKKEPDVFRREKLQNFTESIPSEYQLKLIDESLFHLAKTESWSKDFCSLFSLYQEYETHGLGVMALHKGIPVSGASSYTYYDKGIEIEIDTRNDYRRKGLALACGAKLILECLDRGLYPSWDAVDLRSVALSEKLGYHMDKEYVTFAITLK